MPELVTIKDIAEMLGVSERTAHRFAGEQADELNFPKPYATLPNGRVWKRSDIARWAKRPPVPLGRKRGRPPKNP